MPLADEYVSTQHARLLLHDGQWYVEDLGSTNGTYIGNERLTRPTPGRRQEPGPAGQDRPGASEVGHARCR